MPPQPTAAQICWVAECEEVAEGTSANNLVHVQFAPDVPESFLRALEDLSKGRVVDLDVALETPPPDSL
jgi:hypothetical protein